MKEGQKEGITRRDFLRGAFFGALGAEVVKNLGWPEHLAVAAEDCGLPFEYGKYETFPGLKTQSGEVVLQYPDVGTLGPDTDSIVGFDFQGDIQTGALIIHKPEGEVLETRVICIKRTDLETVQFNEVLRGDRFDVYQISKYGGNKALDEMARLHAKNTAREHQKVVYLGDLGLFQRQYGQQEKAFLNRIIRAQRAQKPGLLPDLGIPESNFVNPRTFSS